jgi:two-component system sensor histidine kinase CpxA
MPAMIKWLIRKIYTINIKLFLWFWLVAITAIVSTKLISEQLAQDVLILPPHPNDQQKLYHAANKIRKRNPQQIVPFLNRNQSNKGALLVIKNIADNTLSPRLKRFNDVFQYLEKNSFNNPTTIKLSNARITGPVKINKGKQQLYIVHRDNKRSFNLLIRQLPYWVRIIIPVFVSFILCWLLARTLSKPISNMKNVANKFGDGDLTARIQKPDLNNDELGDLARTFNTMANKIQQNVEAHQRLLGDVSHELRSPMTRLQIAIALAEKSKAQPDILEKHLSRCEIEVERLDKMIEEVLSLSRLENSLHHTEFQTLELAEVIQPLVEDNQYLADSSHITIKTNICEEPCKINGDEALLASAINNILLNAVKYSPSNSVVTLSVMLSSNNVIMRVSDQGPGVPDTSLVSLFKPFYRTSDARERKTGGTGLGLAIAKQAITIHGGTVKAENNESAGLTVTIELPLLTDNATI